MSYVANLLADVFLEAGAELPWVTEFLIQESLYYWIVPLGVACSFAAHHLGYLSRAHALLIGSVGTITSSVVCVIALYMPIFQLGALVQ
jgi:type II secretory pathway component PulF